MSRPYKPNLWLRAAYPETSFTRELCPSCLSCRSCDFTKVAGDRVKNIKNETEKKTIDLVHGVFDIVGDTSSCSSPKYVLGTGRK